MNNNFEIIGSNLPKCAVSKTKLQNSVLSNMIIQLINVSMS